MVLSMNYKEDKLFKSLEELSSALKEVRARLYDGSRLIRVDYDTISKIFWTDDGGFLDSEYTEAVDFLNKRWSNWCKHDGLMFRREIGGVRLGLLGITDLDDGIEVTMSNVLSRALGDKSDLLKVTDLQNLNELDLKQLSDNGVCVGVINGAIDYLRNSLNSEIDKLYDVWTDITNESFGLELIDFFKRRMVDSYNFAYDGVVIDIWELTMNEQTKEAAQKIFDEMCRGHFRTWYEGTIKNKQSLGRIYELAEMRNNLQRLI